VSWLLIAFIPGLLMLATFGLDRLEASLDGDVVSEQDVTAYVEQAKAVCAKPAAHTGDVLRYELLDDAYEDEYEECIVTESPRGLPARVFIHHGSNPEFQATRHAYRV
jgi:hypothetical protein